MLHLSINKIQHVGIPVTDLERSIPFYHNLGFHIAMDSPFEYEGDQGRCIMLQQGEIVLELYQFPPHALDPIRQRKNGKVDHIAFDVVDITQTFETLMKHGITPIESEPVYLPFWKNGVKFFNILGPDGERLEFNQIL